MTITDLETLPDVLGWRLLSPPPPSRNPLSPRERQILDLVTGGRTHKEVAFDLGLSDATVRVLYSRAMKKLGRSKRARVEPVRRTAEPTRRSRRLRRQLPRFDKLLSSVGDFAS